ncbi:PorV/PorQ family protein [bacterium BMS3Abin03]|nr:PorV/PorQ family protein [bacterium BMS3Abin03]MCG6959409.1 PorV/PorQ family protein [bacterium BMS3Abin03]
MKKLLLIIFSISLLQSIGFSQVTKTGTTAAKFLSIGIGPRANAMGGAFTSIVSDASALYWNPAGAADLTRYEALFTYTSLFKDLNINLNYFALVIPADEVGSFGVSVTALDYGDMDVTTEYYPEGTGEKFSAASYAFGLSYARHITENFSAGVTVKYITEGIFNSSANGVAFDIGTIFKTPFFGIKFASIITNYGSKMQMTGEDLLIRYDADPSRHGNNSSVDGYIKTDQFELPLRLQIGISKDIQFFDGQRLTLAVDATHPNDNAEYVNVGGELSFLDNLIFLRAGYKGLFLKDNQEGLTLGAGLDYALGVFSVGFDYSYQEFEFLSYTHSFGVSLKF